MKVWQDTGWDRKIRGLQGNSLRVLLHLIATAGWNNQIPSPNETAISMSWRRSNISRAYAQLREADLLYQKDNSYYLNPYFCWKGNSEQYDEACHEILMLPEFVQQSV